MSWGAEVDAHVVPAEAGGNSQEFDLEEVMGHLREVWSEVLGHADFDNGTNFFEVGGHSVKATSMLIKLRRRVGALLPVREVFDHPTIQGLAVLVQNRIAASGSVSGPRPGRS
ncbi:acyl carrier protein [Allokutzneria sp. A3M-2-11 16]|uniref:acyl carrier protein n=1 Tax=Allokutzneria sp. A3M-2-11 16 TaxID=2962043 RepID=UPI0020B6BB9C|nr:acyl carrier protein [Allokutzneria sp. A3M-2-11 16]MCP3803426.1 acyl carrier protein [Allokutzneria sp. A3M-2-11 16]